MSELTLIYFSATDTTRKCVSYFAEAFCPDGEVREFNLADKPDLGSLDFTTDSRVIFASPVYAGRLPAMVADALSTIKGNGAKAVAMAVYGNRDYDDALLELTDILTTGGFSLLGAGAFVAQHSIFPKVATARPDDSDIAKLHEFARECKRRLAAGETPQIDIKGNRPYKKISVVPIHPTVDKRLCTTCGECARKCPVGAIDPANPTQTDTKKCISCGRCIHTCPRKARQYDSVTHKAVGALFKLKFASRKEPEWA